MKVLDVASRRALTVIPKTPEIAAIYMMTQNPPLSCFGAGFFALGGDFTGDLTEDFFATPPLGAMAFSFGVVARAETRAETRAGDLAGVFLVGVFLGAALGVVAFFAGVTAFLEGVFAGVAFFAGDFAGVAAFLAGVTAFLEGVLAGVAAFAGDLGAAPLIPRNLSLRSLLLRAFSADLNSASARMVAQAPSRSREQRKGNRRWGQISRGVGCGGTDGAASGAGRGGRRARRSSRGFELAVRDSTTCRVAAIGGASREYRRRGERTGAVLLHARGECGGLGLGPRRGRLAGRRLGGLLVVGLGLRGGN